ncbi:MAG: hypothetical protein M1838_005689 [Thelocarpon superellum]|nr:MAG: hypothetical protein M1838_005689 [Thelocarpon superellum]
MPSPASQQDAPPSPAPAAAAPTTTTPGTRATALNTIFGEALAHTLRTCSYENFAACFPTPARHCPGSLRALWAQMVERLEGHAKSEFDAILAERAVVPALNDLDRLIADARRRKARTSSPDEVPVPPHTLPPSSHLQAHLEPFLTQQRSHLNAKLQTTQSQNAALAAKIHDQEAEIRTLLSTLMHVVEDVEAAGTVLEEGGGQLGKETVALDVALRTSS